MRRFWRFYFLRVVLILVALELVYFAWLQYRNNKPEAVEDSTMVYQRHSIRVELLRNDTDEDEDDTLHIEWIDTPLSGTFKKISESAIEYKPDDNFTGIDSFKYTINDGDKVSKPAFIKIRVNENKAPVANQDMFKVFPWSDATLPVMNNDNDRESDTMFIVSVTEPESGKVKIDKDVLRYKWYMNSSKVDSFYYKLSDGVTISDSMKVIVEIKDVTNSKFSSSYYGDLRNYEQFDPSRWDIIEDEGSTCLAINTTDYNGLSGNRCGAYNMIKNRLFNGDFNIQLRIKCTENLEQNNAADHAVYFAYTDPENYCYASFSSNQEGDGFTGIYRIVNGQRETVYYHDQAFNDNNFHTYQIIRKGNEITTKVDGRELCKASDDTFGVTGQIGIGSYNDMAHFDDISISGSFITK